MMNEEKDMGHHPQVTFNVAEGGAAAATGGAAAPAPQDLNASATTTPTGTTSSGQYWQEKSLSVVSKQYDRTNKGYLDPTERAMRELDASGRGHVPNHVVYDLMRESVAMHQKMATQRWMLVALGGFTALLALANMATAFAAASLAKDTTVSATTNDLNVKGTTNQRVGTTARADTFSLGGTAPESGADRRRRLRAFDITADLDYSGHTTLDALVARNVWERQQQDAVVHLNWTCGAIRQGREFRRKIRGGSRIPYMGNVTEGTVNGTLYIYEVDREFGHFQPLPDANGYGTNANWSNSEFGLNADADANSELGYQSSSAQLSGLTLPAVPQYQQIYVDCQDGADVCTVANTNCCVHTWDEETMLFTDDCPGDHTCAGCGCMCIPPGTPTFRCYSGCELTEPYEEEPLPIGGFF